MDRKFITFSWLLAITCLIPPVQACIIILVPTINVEKVTITIPDPPICGFNCFDSATATVDCPGFNCNQNIVNGCPSDAECKAPVNPDGTRNALARAHGNCLVPERWTGWIVRSGIGCTADAQATANRVFTVTNITSEIITFGWQVYWIPFHSYYWVNAFDTGANGAVEMTYVITDLQNPTTPLLESISVLTDTSPGIVYDNINKLAWQRFPYTDHASGKFYPNAFRPMQNQILVGQYSTVLQPHASTDLKYTLSTTSKLLHSGPGQQIQGGAASTPLVGPGEILSKTVGVVGCLVTLPGDINNDCIVDLQDFVIMATNWLQAGEIL